MIVQTGKLKQLTATNSDNQVKAEIPLHLSPTCRSVMITILVKDCNSIDQITYDSIVGSLQLHAITCSCGHAGCLIRHGYYVRTVTLKAGTFDLRILRLKCKECGKTHAILLANIVPYQRIGLAEQIDIINSYLGDRSYEQVLEAVADIDENNIKRVIKVFRDHWFERIKSANIFLDKHISKNCFAHYSRQFMQVKRTNNLIFEPTT